jgi:hypothetical protein
METLKLIRAYYTIAMVEIPEKFDGMESDIERLEEKCICEVDGFDYSLVIKTQDSENRHLFATIEDCTDFRVHNVKNCNDGGLLIKLKP